MASIVEELSKANNTDERVNILMVADQPVKLLIYEVMLEKLGENLLKAISTNEALDILLKSDVAAVLIDVSMSDVEGLKLADAIRRHPRLQSIAIIFISDMQIKDSNRIRGFRSGAVDYIFGPVIPEEVRAKIGMFVELHRKTRMIERMNKNLEALVAERPEESRRRETLFRMRAELLDLATEAIMVRDLEGKIQFWNSGAEKMYGWTREEALGRNLHGLLHSVFQVPREQVDAELRERRCWQGNVIQTAKDGAEMVVSFRKTVNEGDDLVLEVGRDITSQMKAEEALRETEKLAAMGRVAGIIAHEINNPLAAVTNLFYLLRNHPSLDESARRCAEMAEQELERVSHITRQTLSFYRESNQPISVLVPELLEDVLGLQQRAIRINRIELRKRYQSASLVLGFPVELRQVFLNLVSNAIQAMPEGGILGVNVREATDWTLQRRGVMISILDTGNGIAPEDARHLFQPFFSTKSTKGTGLGLWISKGIVQKYDGRISFRTWRNRKGCTTCFRVFLPASSMAVHLLGTADMDAEDYRSSHHDGLGLRNRREPALQPTFH